MTMKQATAMTLALLARLLLACDCPNFTTLRTFQNSVVPTAAPFLLPLKSHPLATLRRLISQQQHVTNSAATNTQEFPSRAKFQATPALSNLVVVLTPPPGVKGTLRLDEVLKFTS
jgi:hypothetical protein